MSAEDDTKLKSAKERAVKLTALQPKSVQAAAFGKWKPPFKVAMIQGLLLCRTIDLANASISFFEQKRVVPALILTRSIVETFSVLFALHDRIERFLENEPKDLEALDEFLMCSLVGSKMKPFPDTPAAVNVLNHIDRFEKMAPGFRYHYDALSEYAHPNWAGVWGVYGTTVNEPPELIFGARADMPGFSAGLSVLFGSLGLFEHYYEDTGRLAQRLNDYFKTL
jgi:DNA-binding XRE family transcriptional regulator